MAETLARLRRTALLVPRLLGAWRGGTALELAEVASSLGADTRTLEADLRALEEIEFESEDRPNYFAFEIRRGDLHVQAVPLMLTGRPQRVRLTEPEAGALLSFLEELELDCADNSRLEELEMLVAHAAGAPEDVRSWSAGGPIPAEHVFTPLLKATRDSLRCRISYTGSVGSIYETLIDPYHLRMERGMWYAIARLAEGPNAGAERCYRLDKIASVAVEGPFDPDPIDLARYADGVFRPSGEPRSVTVVFSEQIAGYAEERWGPGRPVDGGVEIDIVYYDEGWLERTLAVFGGQACAGSGNAGAP